jgi:hypothetical protein
LRRRQQRGAAAVVAIAEAARIRLLQELQPELLQQQLRHRRPQARLLLQLALHLLKQALHLEVAALVAAVVVAAGRPDRMVRPTKRTRGRSVATSSIWIRATGTPACCTKARVAASSCRPARSSSSCPGLEGEWQQVQIIARGNTLIHMVNGKVISVVVDDNPTFRAFQGILSLQLEGSGQIWYRNVYVKSLDKPMEFPK